MSVLKLTNCRDIARRITYASIKEILTNKPGNASPKKDIRSVKFSEILSNAMELEPYYYQLCMKGVSQEKGIYDHLYSAIVESKKKGISFHLLGTALLNMPIAYVAGTSPNLADLRSGLGRVIRELDQTEFDNFRKSLQIVSPSYLGRLDMSDYRNFSGSMYDVLVVSSESDRNCSNMVNGYVISFEIYEWFKSNGDSEETVTLEFLNLLSNYPDTLLYRKHGGRVSLQVSELVRSMLNSTANIMGISEFLDRYLTERGFNPGSTADLIASGLALYYLDKLYSNRNNESFTYNENPM
ncbi:hypothetical protein HS7_16950 [Sulfolobales archaeon HS-7]|nr:hypothetical protein HS7_16950 [Sulfolobales archaeon HS-7]